MAAKTGRLMQIAARVFMERLRFDASDVAHARLHASRLAWLARDAGRPRRRLVFDAFAMLTGSPPTRLPGSTITCSPASRPLTISMRSPSRRPVLTRFSEALAVLHHEHLVDARERHQRGGGHDHRLLLPPAVTISAFANEPGRSWPCWFGTSASTISVRLLSSIAGLTRATRPL